MVAALVVILIAVVVIFSVQNASPVALSLQQAAGSANI